MNHCEGAVEAFGNFYVGMDVGAAARLLIVRRQNEVLARGRLMAIASRPLRGAAIRAADDAVPRRVAREIRLDLGGNSDASQ